MKKEYKGYVFIMLTAVIFSTMEISGKMLAGEIDSFQLTFLRFLIGGLMLLPFAVRDIRAKNLILKKDDYVYFVITGLLCVPLSMAFLQLAVVYTKASLAALIFSTNAVLTVPFAYLILKESVNKKMCISILISIIGLLFILNPFGMTVNLKGLMFGILSALTFSLYTVITKKRIGKYGGYVFNFMTFIIGDAILLLMLVLFKMPIIHGVTSSNIIVILYMGIVVTGLGYIFYLGAIKETSAVASSAVFLIKPALAPVLSLLFLGETLSPNAIVGILLILAGSYVGIKSK